MRSASTDRAVSPVVGVVLMVVITLLLAGVVGAFALSMDMNQGTAEGLVEGEPPTASDTPSAGPTAEPTPNANQDDLVVAENATAGADGVVHSTVIEVGSDADGTELDSVLIEYPKDEVDMGELQHDDVLTMGVDTDGDGDLEETFDDPSGVNINDNNSHVEITLDSGYTVSEGDRVVFRFDDADNPDAAGEYNVTVELNGAQTIDGVLVVE